MPLNESTRKTRERWPLAFDLEGVPRETAVRSRLIEQQQISESQLSETEDLMHTANVPLVQNTFAVDYQAGNAVIDINNPPQKPYKHQEFPKLVYHHETGHVLTAHDEKQLKLAQKKGYDVKPAPDRDYSQISRAGIAPIKAVVEAPPLTDEQLLAATDDEE